MSKSKHTEAQIIGALKQVEAGRSAEDVAREQGVSKHTIYAWKAKYGGMDVSEAEEVKHLRDENARLKKLVAAASVGGNGFDEFSKASAIYRPVGFRAGSGALLCSAPVLSPSR